MKVYISADIEGVTGSTNWDEANKTKSDYAKFAEQMTKEVKAACMGAIKAGADEIWVKDAHGSGRNIDISQLPKNVMIIRGWSGHPFSMVQDLDETFDALMYIGYHSAGGTNSNPLSHTMTTDVRYVKINGEYASEFTLHSYIAAMLNVPVVFLSGDKGLVDEALKLNSNIKTVGVKTGVGGSTISMSPELSLELIEKGVENSLKGDLKSCKINLPDSFILEICYKDHKDAYRYSFYPGVEQISQDTLKFKTDDYFELIRATHFIL